MFSAFHTPVIFFFFFWVGGKGKADYTVTRYVPARVRGSAGLLELFSCKGERYGADGHARSLQQLCLRVGRLLVKLEHG